MTLSDHSILLRLKRAGMISLIFIGILLLIYFLFRNLLLNTVFEKFTKRLKENRQVELSLTEVRFTGFSGIVMKNVVLVPEQKDTLLTIDSVYVCPSLLALLTGKIKLNEAALNNASLFLTCQNEKCNYDFLKTEKREDASDYAERNYGSLVNKLVSRLFNYTPQRTDFHNLFIQYTKDDKVEQLMIPSFTSSRDEMHGSFLNLSDSTHWTVAGKFSQRSRTFDFKIYPNDKKELHVPFIQSLFATQCTFDTLRAVLSEYEASGKGVKMIGSITATEMRIVHKKISDDPVTVHQADFNFKTFIGNDYIQLDSASMFLLNKMLIQPYILITNDGNKKYNLKIDIDRAEASDFFNSLPEGMFDVVDGIQAEGKLDYNLGFLLDASEPDSLFFNSELKKENFHLKKFGSVNLSKMNEEFMYDAYDGDHFVRSFAVGPSNPDFTPLEQISAYLKNAIMTSEDGSFFFHNGFNEDAFGKSIAANYKAGKFVRGGSTITMQLVKNVFLTRHKTIARKVEEALIVWLIESNHISSKERMLEVYLNIIELGPGIYGVGEASRFYFNKKPSELSLAESVFIASLLPRPKWFKYSFDEQGNLKPYFADYYRVVANFLLKKNLITQIEYDQLQPHVELKGPALNFITPVDSLPPVEEDPAGEQE